MLVTTSETFRIILITSLVKLIVYSPVDKLVSLTKDYFCLFIVL